MKIWASFVIVAVLVAGAPAYKILSEAEDQVVRIGSDILFSCEVENLEAHMQVTWNNGSSLLSLGRNKFTPDDRVSIEGTGNDYTMLIRDVNVNDEGSYYCGIAGTSTSLEHSLTVNIPPEVYMDPEGEQDVLEGDPLTLTCEATGKPDPVVTWSKVNGFLPNGLRKYEGQVLTLTNLSREHSGEYVCTAHNEEDTDRETVFVSVRYPPTITVVEESTIYTGPRDSVRVECEFSASPEVNVLWHHNGSDIVLPERTNLIIRQEEGEQGLDIRVLEISNLQSHDLGEYTCQGANRFGRAEASYKLTAKPKFLNILSEEKGPYSNEFTLEWEMSSVSPPLDYTLVVSLVNESGTFEFGTNSIPAAVVGHGVSHHEETYTIKGLEPNQTYKAELQGRNAFDVSEWAVISFTTADAGKTPPPPTPSKPETETEKTPTEPDLTPEENNATTAGAKDNDEDSGQSDGGHATSLKCPLIVMVTVLLLGNLLK